MVSEPCTMENVPLIFAVLCNGSLEYLVFCVLGGRELRKCMSWGWNVYTFQTPPLMMIRTITGGRAERLRQRDHGPGSILPITGSNADNRIRYGRLDDGDLSGPRDDKDV